MAKLNRPTKGFPIGYQIMGFIGVLFLLLIYNAETQVLNSIFWSIVPDISLNAEPDTTVRAYRLAATISHTGHCRVLPDEDNSFSSAESNFHCERVKLSGGQDLYAIYLYSEEMLKNGKVSERINQYGGCAYVAGKYYLVFALFVF